MTDEVEPVGYGIDDFIISAKGQQYSDSRTVWLKHSGDYIEVSPAAGVDSVTFAVTQRYAFHSAFSSYDKTFQHTVKLTVGQTKRWTCKEQYNPSGKELAALGLIDLPSWALGGAYMDNMDISVSLQEVKIADAVQPLQEPTALGTEPPGVSGPEKIDWVPWVIGGIIIIVIAALVYWYFLRGRTVFGHKFGPKAPARPPASAPAVAAPSAPAPAPAPAPAVEGGK